MTANLCNSLVLATSTGDPIKLLTAKEKGSILCNRHQQVQPIHFVSYLYKVIVSNAP